MGVNVLADTISLENSTFGKQTFLLRENPGIYYLGLWDAVQIIWCNSFCSLKWLYAEFHKGNILLFPRHGIPALWEAVLLELPWQMYFSKLGFYTPPLHILLPKGHPELWSVTAGRANGLQWKMFVTETTVKHWYLRGSCVDGLIISSSSISFFFFLNFLSVVILF